MRAEKLKLIKRASIICALFIILNTSFNGLSVAAAMPFYDLRPEPLTLRASFYTSFTRSSEERKHNIRVAAAAIDGTLVDVGGEFSFNRATGIRNEKSGYKKAKIIVGGQFVDGIGGGVCQVSSTLYNAALLAGLSVTEFHPHSLAVSYVAPSFDAMVSYGFADLRFTNDTRNPLIIKAVATESTVKIEIYGEKMDYSLERESLALAEIEPPQAKEEPDLNGEYPELYEGERMFLTYPKKGLRSEGYLVKKKNGKIVCRKKIRADSYSAIRGVIILGTATRPESKSDNTPSENTANGQQSAIRTQKRNTVR